MAKYTTLVRSICEVKSNTETKGLSNINDILDKSWDKIFTKNWEIFDEKYRKILCEKILRSYYTREICAETVELWRLWLDATMCEIMPKYNELYETTILEYNPLYNFDLTETLERTETGNKDNTVTTDNTGSNKVTNNLSSANTGTVAIANTGSEEKTNDNIHKHSDTPQGGITGLAEDKYLSDADINSGSDTAKSKLDSTTTNNLTTTNTGTVENSSSNTNKETGKETNETTESYTKRIVGKNSGESYSRIIKELRENIINIDSMIIDELKPLFFNLW